MAKREIIILPQGTVVSISGVEVTLEQGVRVSVDRSLSDMVKSSVPFFHESSLRIKEE